MSLLNKFNQEAGTPRSPFVTNTPTRKVLEEGSPFATPYPEIQKRLSVAQVINFINEHHSISIKSEYCNVIIAHASANNKPIEKAVADQIAYGNLDDYFIKRVENSNPMDEIEICQKVESMVFDDISRARLFNSCKKFVKVSFGIESKSIIDGSLSWITFKNKLQMAYDHRNPPISLMECNKLFNVKFNPAGGVSMAEFGNRFIQIYNENVKRLPLGMDSIFFLGKFFDSLPDLFCSLPAVVDIFSNYLSLDEAIDKIVSIYNEKANGLAMVASSRKIVTADDMDKFFKGMDGYSSFNKYMGEKIKFNQLSNKCFNCNKEGHLAKEYNKPYNRDNNYRDNSAREHGSNIDSRVNKGRGGHTGGRGGYNRGGFASSRGGFTGGRGGYNRRVPIDTSGIRCFNCQEYGHYATTCPKRHGVRSVSVNQVDDMALVKESILSIANTLNAMSQQQQHQQQQTQPIVRPTQSNRGGRVADQ